MKEPTAFYNKNVSEESLMHHLKIQKGDISRYVILPGDPKRCALIAEFLDDPVLLADYREYVTVNGTYKGVPVTICSTGIGGPSAAIAAEELYKAGADTLIRVGTSGALKMDVEIGDVVVAQASVRDEGTADQYILREFPARADYNVVCALRDAANNKGMKSHVGIVHSKDSFYTELEPGNSFFREKEEQKLQWYAKTGVLSSEMETAALFAVGTLRGIRTGAVLQVVGKPIFERMNVKRSTKSSIEPIIQTALDAIVILAEKDKE